MPSFVYACLPEPLTVPAFVVSATPFGIVFVGLTVHASTLAFKSFV